MSLQDAILDDLALVFLEQGIPAIYLAHGSEDDGIPITVIITYGEDLDDAQWRAALQASAEVLIQESEVNAPQVKDTITIDEVEWSVVRKISRSGGVWKLALLRDLRPTFRK